MCCRKKWFVHVQSRIKFVARSAADILANGTGFYSVNVNFKIDLAPG